MQKSFRRLACVAALAAATLSPLAHAQPAVINFEDPALTGLYFPDESFSQSGFQMTQLADFGTVDTGVSLGAAAPTNNTTQFYFNSNDGFLSLTSLNGLGFSLDGFSAAFVPLLGSPAPPQTLGIVAAATTLTGDSFGIIFGLGNTTSTTQGSPFLTFAGASNFASFTNLLAVDFFTCTISNGAFCTLATRNNAQFALDNILVTGVAAPIPEPETMALMAIGLMALTAVSRRRRTRASAR